MKSETLPLKTIINEFIFLRKIVIIQKESEKKDLLLLATKLEEKIADLCNAKEYYECFMRKKT